MFDVSYSVKEVSTEQLNKCLDDIKSRIVINEKTLMLVSIKKGNLYTLSELRSIINEICDSLIINNNQAAITLTNHLFENALKQVLIKWDSQGKQFSKNQLMEESLKKEVKRFDGEYFSAVPCFRLVVARSKLAGMRLLERSVFRANLRVVNGHFK